MAERGDRLAEAQVVGAEVVAPLADAVRLVDDEQRDAGARRSSSIDVLVGELLRGEEHELDLVVLGVLEHLVALAARSASS